MVYLIVVRGAPLRLHMTKTEVIFYMREYEPIRIRPLTLRGVFGITWKVFSRRFGALLGYHALYLLVAFLIIGIALLPILQPLLSLDAAAWNSIESSGADAFRIVGGLLVALLLLMLSSLLLSLLIMPIYSGTMYGEMSARIYGSASSVGLMLRRSKFSLKRFFTTTLCNMLAALGISLVVRLVTSVFTSFITISAVFNAVPYLLEEGAEGFFHAGAGLVIPFILLFIVMVAVQLAGSAFLLFVYPVAVNEPVKNFAAIKRSFTLVGKRYGRVFGCTLIVAGITLLPALLAVAGFALSVALGGTAGVVLGVLSALLYLAIIILLSPYEMALATVLYFDSRTRLEGTAWLGEPEAQPAQPVQSETQEQPAPQELPAPEPAQPEEPRFPEDNWPEA